MNVDEVLRSRAEMIARAAEGSDGVRAGLPVVILRIGTDRYAVPLSELAEVVRAPKIAPVPHAPAQVAGLIQVRGEIRPVYHLKVLLGQQGASGSAAELGAVVLVRRPSGAEFGLGADGVEDIREIPPEARKPAGSMLAGHAAWMTEDLIPCLTLESLDPELN